MSTEKWDTADIADYLGVTREHVTDKLVKRDDFPPPFLHRGPRIRRWLADEVRQWANERQSLAAMDSELAR